MTLSDLDIQTTPPEVWYPVAMDLATAVQSLEQAPAVQPAAPPPTVIPVEELAMYHGFIANIHNHSTP